MAMVEWRIQGREFANCNCAYGCPCQFSALPTRGYAMYAPELKGNSDEIKLGIND